MGKTTVHLHSLNQGECSRAGLARVDVERVRLAAEIQENIFPHVIGKGTMRPGTTWLGNSKSDAQARGVAFQKSIDVTAILELTNALLRVWVDDALVTRASVTSTVTNGDFSSGTGWTLTTTGDATANINSTASGALYMACPNRGGTALAERSVTTSSAGTQHALRITVTRGPVLFRCGSASGLDDYVEETELETGIHSLAFTPTGTYYVRLFTRLETGVIVDSIQVESAGVMELTAPWTTAQLYEISTDQSIDVMYLAHEAWQTRKIERRGDASWSIVLFKPDDGPFTQTRTAKVRIKPTATRGNTTLTADANFFRTTHVGALFRLTHERFNATFGLGGDDVFTDAWRVTGIKSGNFNDRSFTYDVSGTFTATARVQVSYDSAESGFKDFNRDDSAATIEITGAVTITHNGDVDSNNQVAWHRIGILDGGYTSGSMLISVQHDGHSGSGVCRVTAYTSPTEVSVEVLTDFKDTAYTEDWQEGEWSDERGWPACVQFHDGRLNFLKDDRFTASESDDYEAFNLDTEGDAGSIQRDVATSGSAEQGAFLCSLTRLIIGTESAEVAARSDAFDAPLTPTKFSLKNAETVGAARVQPVKIGKQGFYVASDSVTLHRLLYNFEAQDYDSVPVGELNEDYGGDGLLELAMQRKPEPYVWAVREDGQCVIVLFSPANKIEGIHRLVTDGEVESACVLKGRIEDTVYLWVKRTVNSSTVRFLEKMALRSECIGGATTKLADAGVFNAGPVTTFTGLSHLEGENVLVWANGVLLNPTTAWTVDSSGYVTIAATYTVSGGQIALGASYTNVFVGLPYTGRYRSAKLAYGAQGGTALLQPKRVGPLGLLAGNIHRDAIKAGPSFAKLDKYRIDDTDGTALGDGEAVKSVHDDIARPFSGTWNTDSRLHMIVRPGHPATIDGIVMQVETNER